jgi:hypothetical protein
MNLFLNIDTRSFYTDITSCSPIKRIAFKRRDADYVNIVFAKNNRPYELEGAYEGFLGIKKLNDYASNFIANASFWEKAYVNNIPTYKFYLNLFTSEIEDEFNAFTEPASQIQAMFEIQWKASDSTNVVVNSSNTLLATISNDVIRGDEGMPVTGSFNIIATQQEAEEGIDNTKLMTPLRTTQLLSSATIDAGIY